MSVVKDTVLSAGMAMGNLVAGERDRPAQEGTMDQRVRKRVQAVVSDASAKTAVSVGAPHAAREVARRAGESVIGRVAAGLASRPLVAAGAALFAVDVIRDGARLASGKMKPSQAVEHLGASATGIVGAAGGAQVGAVLGTALIPVPIVGTLVGGLVGSVAGGLAGDQLGRGAVRTLLGSRPGKKT